MKQLRSTHMITGLLLSIVICLCLCSCALHSSSADDETLGVDSAGGVDNTPFSVQRYDLDAGNENVAFFFEIPVWEADSPAAEKFNAFFAALYADFSESEPERVREIVSSAVPGAPTAENPYRDCWTTAVRACTDRYISVSIAYDWYMGGVVDYGINGYTFDRLSGERVYLNDVIPESDEIIKAAIIDSLKESTPEIADIADAQGNTPLDTVKALPIKEIDFFISEDGCITVVFDKYEIAPGAAGMLLAVLKEIPTPISPDMII